MWLLMFSPWSIWIPVILQAEIRSFSGGLLANHDLQWCRCGVDTVSMWYEKGVYNVYIYTYSIQYSIHISSIQIHIYILYDMIYDIWYMKNDMIYEIWYMICDIWYDIICDVMWYDMIWSDMICIHILNPELGWTCFALLKASKLSMFKWKWTHFGLDNLYIHSVSTNFQTNQHESSWLYEL